MSLEGLTDEGKRWFETNAVAHPIGTLTQRVRIENPAAASIPRSYIECTAGKNGAPVPEDVKRARAQEGWAYAALPTCHWPMITMPERLSELLLHV